MSEINLLPQQQSGAGQQRALTITRYVAIGLMFLVTASSGALFFLNIQSPLSQLVEREKQLLASLSTYDKRANTYMVTGERLNSISSLLSKRTDYGNYMDILLRQAGSGTIVDGFVLSEKTVKTLTLTVSSRSLLSINTYIDNISKLAEDQKLFKRIILSDVAFESGRGVYTVTILAQIP